jgi:hypothetical protein
MGRERRTCVGKYMFIYRGPVTPPNQVTEQESAAQLDEWLAWEARVGNILIDDGARSEIVRARGRIPRRGLRTAGLRNR